MAEEKGKSRIFYGLDDTYDSIAVVSLGKGDKSYNDIEEIDEDRENVRAAVAGQLLLSLVYELDITLYSYLWGHYLTLCIKY